MQIQDQSSADKLRTFRPEGTKKIALSLEDDAQKLIAIGILTLLERGARVHDVAGLTQEIVKQVWYGYQAEQRGVDNDASGA